MSLNSEIQVLKSRLINFNVRLEKLEASGNKQDSVDLKPIMSELAELRAMVGALQAIKAPVKAARPVKTAKKEPDSK